MKQFLTGVIVLFSVNLYCAQETDPNVALIQKEFEAYLRDFIARDAVLLATHFQFPSINKLVIPNSVFHTKEEITEFWDSFPLQDGYAYSTVDNLEIHRLADPIYYLDLDYSRYNDADELLYEGSSIYLYGNETGSWKIFFQWTGDRE
jgi:hypothetical protein